MRQFWRSIVLIVLVIGCGTAAAAQTTSKRAPQKAQTEAPGLSHEICGIVKSIDAGGSRLTVETRTGRLVQVDATTAIQTRHINLPPAGHPVEVRGTYDAKGVLLAETILRQKESPTGWPADR
jgi:hypothetical protein